MTLAGPNIINVCQTTNRERSDPSDQFTRALYLLSVYACDHVSALKPCLRGRTVLICQFADHHALTVRDLVQASDLRRHLLRNYAQVTATHSPFAYQLIVDVDGRR